MMISTYFVSPRRSHNVISSYGQNLIDILGENGTLGRMFGTKIGDEVAEKWRKYEDLNSL
jgi:hypothetical protein